jgi:5-methylcytosine-specific restriction enzyme A
MTNYPYNTASWRRLREAHLAPFPFCEPCGELGRALVLANTVDHRVPISAGGFAFPAHDGLMSCCASCHSQKTARGSEAGAVRTDRSYSRGRGAMRRAPDRPGASLEASASCQP